MPQQHMYAGCSLVLNSMQVGLAFALPVAVVGSRSLCLKRVVQDR